MGGTVIRNSWHLPCLIAILMSLLVITVGCSHRPAPVIPIEQTAPAKAATSTNAQSAEIAPLVVTAVAAGTATAAACIGLGISGILPSKPATAGAVAGGTLAVGALTLQRFLPYIPWLIVAGLVCGLGWLALHNRKIKALWKKDRAKLQQVANTVAIAATDGTKAPTFAALADDLAKHLQ